jgi:hypothetical protein
MKPRQPPSGGSAVRRDRFGLAAAPFHFATRPLSGTRSCVRSSSAAVGDDRLLQTCIMRKPIETCGVL